MHQGQGENHFQIIIVFSYDVHRAAHRIVYFLHSVILSMKLKSPASTPGLQEALDFFLFQIIMPYDYIKTERNNEIP